MTKKDIQKKVLQNGKHLSLDKFEWDEKIRLFSTEESNLILDFTGINGITFKTGRDCYFKTGRDCNFNTGWNCMFDTGNHCSFNTGNYCIFNTGNYCDFKTGYGCIFYPGSNSTFETSAECVIIRRDTNEVIKIPIHKKIKLNEFQEKGYTILDNDHIIIIDGKEIKLSEESYNNLKEQFK